MKRGVALANVLVLVMILFISSCSPHERSQDCSKCPTPSAWTPCDETGNKTRVNYECDDNSGYTCTGFQEKAPCQGTLSLSGFMNMNAQVTPAKEDNTLGGIIKVNVANLPNSAGKVWVIISPNDGKGSATLRVDEDRNVIIQESDWAAGKDIWVETKKVADGAYSLIIMATSSINGSAWIDMAQKQVVIKNTK